MRKESSPFAPRIRLVAFLAGLAALAVTSWLFHPAPPLYLLSAALVCAFQFYLVFHPKVQSIINDEKLSDFARAAWHCALWVFPLQFPVTALSNSRNLPFANYMGFVVQWMCIWVFCFTFVAFYATYWRKDKPKFDPP